MQKSADLANIEATYLRDLGSCVFLSKEEEIKLHKKMMKCKTKKARINARNKLVEAVLPFLVYLAKRNTHSYASLNDKVGILNLYIVENMHKFNPKRGRLTTFVSWQVRAAFARSYLREHIVRLPSSKKTPAFAAQYEAALNGTEEITDNTRCKALYRNPDPIKDNIWIWELIRLNLTRNERFAIRGRLLGIKLGNIAKFKRKYNGYRIVSREMARQWWFKGIRKLKAILNVDGEEGRPCTEEVKSKIRASLLRSQRYSLSTQRKNNANDARARSRSHLR